MEVCIISAACSINFVICCSTYCNYTVGCYLCVCWCSVKHFVTHFRTACNYTAQYYNCHHDPFIILIFMWLLSELWWFLGCTLIWNVMQSNILLLFYIWCLGQSELKTGTWGRLSLFLFRTFQRQRFVYVKVIIRFSV